MEEIEQQRAPPPAPPPTAPARPVPGLAVNGTAERQPSPARGKPMPPAPPAKRPAAAGRKPAPAPPVRDSAVSLSTNSGTDSGRATPNSIGGGSLAGGLAEALKARQSAMSQRDRDEDDDW